MKRVWWYATVRYGTVVSSLDPKDDGHQNLDLVVDLLFLSQCHTCRATRNADFLLDLAGVIFESVHLLASLAKPSCWLLLLRLVKEGGPFGIPGLLALGSHYYLLLVQ